MRRTLAPAVVLVAVGLLLAADHIAWSAACSWPVVRGDGTRHSLVAVEAALRHAADPSWLELRTLYRTNYYPAGVAWLSLPVSIITGPSSQVFRAFLGLFTGLLAVGTGALAWRLSGPRAAVGAALMTGTIPLLWTLRADVMLDVPLAAWVAVFLALLPVGPAPRWRALLCGLALAAGMLSKQTMPYLALPALAVVAARIAWSVGGGWRARVGLVSGVGLVGLVPAGLFVSGLGWSAVGAGLVGTLGLWAGARKGLPAGDLRTEAENFALIALVAVVLAGPWYAVSVEPILMGLEITRQTHADVPQGLPGLVRILGMSEYLLFFFVPVPILLLAGLGSGQAFWRLRGASEASRLLLPVLASLGVGGVLISRFPDLHARHYVPLLPMVVALAALPLGTLAARARWGRHLSSLLVLILALWNGSFAASWRADGPTPALLTVDRRDADIPPHLPAARLAELPRRMWRIPDLFRVAAPRTEARALPVTEAMAAIVADRATRFPAQQAVVFADDPEIEDPGLRLLVVEAGAAELHPLFPPTRGRILKQRTAGPVYLLDLLNEGSRGRPFRRALRSDLKQMGFAEVARFPARMGQGSAAVALVVFRLDPAPSAAP